MLGAAVADALPSPPEMLDEKAPISSGLPHRSTWTSRPGRLDIVAQSCRKFGVGWKAVRRATAGCQPHYSNLAIYNSSDSVSCVPPAAGPDRGTDRLNPPAFDLDLSVPEPV